MIPVLDTKRLVMRGWRQEDIGPFATVYADPESTRYIGGVADRRLAWCHMAFFMGHWELRGFGLWAFESKETREFVGWGGLHFPEGAEEREISWVLAPAARGSGLATEAGFRARAYAYDVLGWTTAISGIDVGNDASVRVAKRLGARLEMTIAGRNGKAKEIWRHPGPDGTFTEMTEGPT